MHQLVLLLFLRVPSGTASTEPNRYDTGGATYDSYGGVEHIIAAIRHSKKDLVTYRVVIYNFYLYVTYLQTIRFVSHFLFAQVLKYLIPLC